ncbi:MAG: WYL domain-containing protein [Desulfobacteraceae bacterium]|nr:WYL domain-containing protein [Desulfobacteraceae bacterium]
MFALVNRLAKESGLKGDPEIQRLQKELGALYCADAKKLADKIHYKRVEVEHVAPEVIRSVLMAFHGNCRLVFDYRKIRGQAGARKVDPLRLVIYQGRWYLLAYCHMRKAMRTFHLARAKDLAVCPEACTAGDAAADFTEIKMKILQYGWRARVLGPPELQSQMAEEVRRMARALEVGV